MKSFPHQARIAPPIPEYGEEEGFGQQLPNHSPAARAECQTHRYLLAARRRAHQLEGRQIDTYDQQNGGDDGEHGGQDLLCIDAGAIGPLRAREHPELWKLAPCGIWRIWRARRPTFTDRIRKGRLQLGERLFSRDARLQSSHHLEPPDRY